MKIRARVEMYKEIFKDCKALEPVSMVLAKGYKGATPLQRLDLLRELDTELADLYNVWIPVITCFVRDDNYVSSTKEIFLGDPDIYGFLHQFRHHLQNEAREQERKYLLVEDNKNLDYKLPYKDTQYNLYGEDDARSWSKAIMEMVLDTDILSE